MAPPSLPDGGEDGPDGGLTLTRRTALALLGVGSVGAAMAGSASADHGDTRNSSTRKWNQHVDAQGHDLSNLHALEVDHVQTAARDADAIVWQDEDGAYHADDRDETLYSGDEFTDAVQSALDSLTDGRTTKEKVVVACSGTMGPHEWDGDVLAIDIPSYTILDFRGTIHVEDEDEALIRPLRALNAEEIEIPRVQIVGNPRSAFWFRNVWNVTFGHIDVRMPEESYIDSIGGGVRIDGFADGRGDDAVRCTDIQVDSAYFENVAGHAFETYSVDRIQIGQVIANGTASGCGVLLNDTQDATVGEVVGKDIDVGGGYAAFRLANGCSDVTCGQVVARNCARGVFTVSESSNATVNSVNIDGTTSHGILIQDGENVSINGGVVKNTGDEGVRIDSRSSDQHRPAQGVSVSNLRIVDEREEPEMPYGINVTEGPRDGPDTSNVRLVNNDVRDSGVDGGINVEPTSTIVRDNVGDGIASGTVTLESGDSPAATVEDVAGDGGASLELRATVVETPDAAFSYEHRFEYNGSGWDLVLEWGTDPGEDLEVDYIVDQPQALIGREESADDGEDEDEGEEVPEFDHDSSPGIVDSFEAGELDGSYEGATGSYEVTDAEPVAHGEYSLKSTVDGPEGERIMSFDGLDRYPAAGTTFSAKVGIQSTETGNAGFAWGAWDLDNYYFARLWRSGEDDFRFQIYNFHTGEELVGDSQGALEANVFYEIVVDWAADGTEMTVTLNDPDGEQLAQHTVTGLDPDVTGGGVGTRGSGLLDEIQILE
ncbi:right-handed parallel beta-helix repeat-containing protein [Halobacteria archaeon AArc-m2/3/4]|uniref:Right-handed parallel beta-helix repeat-containing protein n=1 Tax=Natronoglomus mannanivorans TaxID=2979990 RepID=A0ABT2QF33_9EURY|nr:right-handed parallel beta-helix repeat-containing protein [Halobacteria archaeon AArc-m2/3/4]